MTVLITAAFLGGAAYASAKWIGPRSYNPAKGEPYECGIPTCNSEKNTISLQSKNTQDRPILFNT